jgi:hypothetical protein
MNNYEKIHNIENIVQPFFHFELYDFFGDICDLPYPRIKELTILFFKKNGKDKKLFLTETEKQIMMDKIQNLNFGFVEIIKNPHFGTYIIVTLE